MAGNNNDPRRGGGRSNGFDLSGSPGGGGFSDILRRIGNGLVRFFSAAWYELKYRLTLLGEKTFAYAESEKDKRENERQRQERREHEQQKKKQQQHAAAGHAPAREKPVRPKSQTGSRYDEDYDRYYKKTPLWLRLIKGIGTLILRGIATIFLICVITGSIVMATAMIYVMVYLDKDIDFDLHKLKLSYTSVIYVTDGTDGDGNTQWKEYLKLHGSENREWVDYDTIPQTVKDAVVAIEDHRFWEHSGVDFRRTIYCFGDMFLHMSGSDGQQGGSTITQQLIKNITGENEVSIDRKLKEIFRALELEKQYTKIEILEAYLNVIALGNGCNGVKSAAKVYFDKDVSELTLAESASLVGITKNPSKYNPLYKPDSNKERQEHVLHEMLEYGFIEQAEYEQAMAEELHFNQNSKYDPEGKIDPKWNWYVDQIVYDLIDDLQKDNEMSEADARYEVYNGGLKIYSCMNVRLQNEAEAIFRDSSNFAKFPGTTQPQCAIVVMNYDGAVQCTVGSRKPHDRALMFSMASQATRQPGSSMKPISSYGPAVAYGLLEVSTPVTDQPIKGYNRGKDWPKNSGGVYRGDIPAVKGLEVSANCVAVRIARVLTPQKMYEFLTERVHLTTLVESGAKNDLNLSASIGGLTQGVTVREMTAAYQIFGNLGVYHYPYTYTKVVDANGDVIIEHSKNDGERAISEESSNIMNRMLHAPVFGGSGTGRSAQFGGFDMFGKTGTTSNDYDRYFAGGTPYYVSCCWFGYEVQKVLAIKSPNHALVAWKKVMRAAHEGLSSDKSFPKSSNVVRRGYCTVSGGIAGAGCSAATGYYSRNSSLPVCPVHAGGRMTKSFTRFLENGGHFNAFTDDETSNRSSTTTTYTTTPPPSVTTGASTTTTSVTTTTTTTTARPTTTTTTAPPETTKSTTKATEAPDPDEPAPPL